MLYVCKHYAQEVLKEFCGVNCIEFSHIMVLMAALCGEGDETFVSVT
jgi:hypothetical protein